MSQVWKTLLAFVIAILTAMSLALPVLAASPQARVRDILTAVSAVMHAPQLQGPETEVDWKQLNTVGAALQHAGLPLVRLDEQELLDTACRTTGLRDFGNDSFREPLRILLRAYETEAQLNLVGRLAARGGPQTPSRHRRTGDSPSPVHRRIAPYGLHTAPQSPGSGWRQPRALELGSNVSFPTTGARFLRR